jgi:hypothetical protein
MMQDPTYYQLLGVDPSATQAEIKSAYRQQARRNHPDQGGNATLFHMIDEAHQTLISPSLRAEYDAWLRGEASDFSGDDTAMHTVLRDDDAFIHAEPFRNAPVDAPIFRRADHADAPARNPRTARVFWAVVLLWIALALVLNVPLLPGLGSGLSTVIFLGACWVAWVLGSFILRMLGWALILGAIISAQWHGATPSDTTVRLIMGATLWLSGHWLWAFRHQRFHSLIASSVLTKLPMSLRPDRRWAPQ